MEEVRPPVVLLGSVSPWERVGEEIVQQRRRPPGEFQGFEAPPDVVKDFADDRRLGDGPYDAHPLDQLRRDHPLLEEQGKDGGLEQAPQDGGVEGRGVDETAVRPVKDREKFGGEALDGDL